MSNKMDVEMEMTMNTSLENRRASEIIGPNRNGNGSNKKVKKSQNRRSLKKSIKFGCSAKKSGALLNFSSKIPRPSAISKSSKASKPLAVSTEVTSEDSSTAVAAAAAALTSTTTTTTTTKLYRTLTATRQSFQQSILQFRKRKSLSQMDFKQSRKEGYHSSTTISRSIMSSSDSASMAILPSITLTPSKTSFTKGRLSQSPTMSDDFYYVIQDPDAKAAGLKIFATIMLNAWRRRRDDVKRLSGEVERLRRSSIKVKNQVHVLNSVYRIEQKQNDDLSYRLRQSLEDMQKRKITCESLTTSIISLNTDKSLLEQKLAAKDQECDGLNTVLAELRSDLFKAFKHHRELQARLSSELCSVQVLENQNSDLEMEIEQLQNDLLQLKVDHQKELNRKDEEIEKLKRETKMLETQLLEFKEKEFILRDYIQSDAVLKSEIKSLKTEVNNLKTALTETIGVRMKTYWHNTIMVQRTTWATLHLFLFYLLPATPPPKNTTFPITFSIEKALSMVKGGILKN